MCGVHITRAETTAVRRGTYHEAAKQCCKYTTFYRQKNTPRKATHKDFRLCVKGVVGGGAVEEEGGAGLISLTVPTVTS